MLYYIILLCIKYKIIIISWAYFYWMWHTPLTYFCTTARRYWQLCFGPGCCYAAALLATHHHIPEKRKNISTYIADRRSCKRAASDSAYLYHSYVEVLYKVVLVWKIGEQLSLLLAPPPLLALRSSYLYSFSAL